MKSDTATATDKKRAGVITARQIEAASAEAQRTGRDVWVTDPAPRGAGRLLVRCRPNGARLLMYRYTGPDGRRDALALGAYDAAGLRGLDLTEARARVGAHLRTIRDGALDLRAHLEAAERERAERQRAQAEAAAAAAAEQAKAERGTLQALIAAYAATLKGRQSHRDAAALLRLHVVEAFPELAAQPAASIKAEQFRDVLAKLIEAGKGRTAAKVRAYLRAAYSVAMRAGLDPTVPGTFADFGVEANPLERLPSLAQYTRALDRTLTLPELRAFWRRLTALPVSPARDAVLAGVLLGGQRMTQLLRCTDADLDLTAGTIVLRDIKGRNRAANPRRHVLPIVDTLRPILEHRRKHCAGPASPLFSSTGKAPLREETAAAIVTDLCAAMAAAGELERGPFALRDLRRTAETHLAAMGVSSDVRAQIQSHGLGGIQAKHYDRHDYAAEKLAALDKWAARLTSEPAKVLPMPRGKRGAR